MSHVTLKYGENQDTNHDKEKKKELGMNNQFIKAKMIELVIVMATIS